MNRCVRMRIGRRTMPGMLALCAIAAAAGGCRGRVEPAAPAGERPAQEMWMPMGTFATVGVPEWDRDRLPEYTEDAKRTFAGLERTLTVYDAASEISCLNAAAGRAPVSVSEHTRRLLELALHYAEVSRGCFDVTVCPLILLWGFSGGTPPDKPLPPELVAEAMTHTGYRHLLVSGDTAFLDQAGMSVDLGGIAKGYAVDVAFDALRARGATNLMVNLGGNMRCTGYARPNRAWTIGVQNPFVKDGIVGMIRMADGMALATSGNYERFVTIGGKRYAHIIDPRTGYPVEGMAGVTVLSNKAVEADAMSTALFVLGMDAGRDVLKALPECHAVFIPDARPVEIWITPNLKGLFDPLPEFAGAVHVL